MRDTVWEVIVALALLMLALAARAMAQSGQD
jgi:formate-dependent nitrite reductase membrane component NrfD